MKFVLSNVKQMLKITAASLSTDVGMPVSHSRISHHALRLPFTRTVASYL